MKVIAGIDRVVAARRRPGRNLTLVEHQPSPGTVTGFRIYADGNLRSALFNSLQHARGRWPNAKLFDIVACDKLADPQPGIGIGWSAPALLMEEPRMVVTFSVSRDVFLRC